MQSNRNPVSNWVGCVSRMMGKLSCPVLGGVKAWRHASAYSGDVGRE
jgi:hypothetical protein